MVFSVSREGGPQKAGGEGSCLRGLLGRPWRKRPHLHHDSGAGRRWHPSPWGQGGKSLGKDRPADKICLGLVAFEAELLPLLSHQQLVTLRPPQGQGPTSPDQLHLSWS